MRTVRNPSYHVTVFPALIEVCVFNQLFLKLFENFRIYINKTSENSIRVDL